MRYLHVESDILNVQEVVSKLFLDQITLAATAVVYPIKILFCQSCRGTH